MTSPLPSSPAEPGSPPDAAAPAPREGTHARGAGAGPRPDAVSGSGPAGVAVGAGAGGGDGGASAAAAGALAVPGLRADGASGGGEAAEEGAGGGFRVRLENFEGPFDLLLSLIAKHRLDVTEVSLSKVTDEFIAYIRGMGPDWDLDVASDFLVIAATLLDLKAARLLPVAELEDEEDLALLEARDLLFARLLQYRAYKRIAELFEGRWADEGLRHPRTVGLEERFAQLLPEVVIGLGAEGFARLAAKAMQPRPVPVVRIDHIHTPRVSVREQAALLAELLRAHGEADFRLLAADAPDTLTVVARFLALLELYREKVLAFEQPEALGPLTVRWIGDADADVTIDGEFDAEDRPDDRPKQQEEAPA